MHAYTVFPQKSWILNPGASSHMQVLKKVYFFKYVHYLPFVQINDGTHSPLLSNGIVQTNPALTLTDVFYVSRFLVNLLSINQLTKQNNCNIIFFPSHCVF